VQGGGRSGAPFFLMRFIVIVLIAGYLSLTSDRIARPIDGCSESPSPTVPNCTKTLPVRG